jgi:outer membrane receptor for ferrienterochelin and colicins
MGFGRASRLSEALQTRRDKLRMEVRRREPLRWVILAMAAAGPLAARAADPDTKPASSAPAPQVSEVVVTARRLNEARATIQPQLGASVYTITSKAIDALPGGANTGLNQVILQAPGVVQDSFGQLHVRGEHNGLQYRLDGVILPEGLSVFGQALNPRLADKVELITGALPAQYGLRTAGIIDITTKSGEFNDGGSVSIYGGSHGEIEPSAEYSGSSGSFNYFVSASYLHDNLGIESPDSLSTPLHDTTDQLQAFAYLGDIIDPSSRVSLILGASNERFQIPDLTGETPSLMFGPDANQPLVVDGQTTYLSDMLNESQKEATYYAVASYLHTTDRFTGQLSFFGRYSTLKFVPDPLGDLLFNGISQDAYKSDVAGGFQAEGVLHVGEAHTVRAGLIGEIDRSTSDTSSQVIPLDPVTNSQTTDQPQTIVDDGGKTAKSISAYLQDEWKLLDTLTVNYGLRFDQFDGYRDENQLSPRVNMVWKATPSTTVHAGYSRYFSPPPFELVGAETVAKFNNTTAASAVTADTTPYSERANYFDAGVSQKVIHALTLGIDSYYKTSKNLIDEGQFGAPIILTPFNYARGRQYGVELDGNFNQGPFTAYANFAYAKNQGEDIITSQFNFSAAELAYIANHYIYLDHDQTYTASAGASYLWRGTRFGGDLIYGSGLRSTGPDGIPNGDHLPGYVQVNLALSHRFENAPMGPLEVRLDVINLFDHVYEIRDGTGVGVGAPQYGPRRGIFAGITQSF